MESSNGRQREQNIPSHQIVLKCLNISNAHYHLVPGTVPGTSLPAWLTPLSLSFVVCCLHPIQQQSSTSRTAGNCHRQTTQPSRYVHQEHSTQAAAVYTSSTDSSASAYRGLQPPPHNRLHSIKRQATATIVFLFILLLYRTATAVTSTDTHIAHACGPAVCKHHDFVPHQIRYNMIYTTN